MFKNSVSSDFFIYRLRKEIKSIIEANNESSHILFIRPNFWFCFICAPSRSAPSKRAPSKNAPL